MVHARHPLVGRSGGWWLQHAGTCLLALGLTPGLGLCLLLWLLLAAEGGVCCLGSILRMGGLAGGTSPAGGTLVENGVLSDQVCQSCPAATPHLQAAAGRSLWEGLVFVTSGLLRSPVWIRMLNSIHT